MLYFLVHCILKQEIIIHDFLQGLHDFGALGNPTWFIIMTLITYILTFINFKLWGPNYPTTAVLGLTGLLIIAIHTIPPLKPTHWVNTILCFPAGMLFYLQGNKIERLLRKTKIPSIFYALLLISIGKIIYDSPFQPLFYAQNLGGALFALGVTWFVGSFSWKSPSRFLVWLGGSGLFVIYMFHLLPMRIMTHMEINKENPYLVWFCVIIATTILAVSATLFYKKINNFLFSKT